jgi:ABC-type amino acid transport substrate-binding protein
LTFPIGFINAAERSVKVGVFDNAPIVSRNKSGNYNGFSVEVLEHIASDENWDLEYVFGTWSECLNRLEKGEIDIQVGIAYSKKRARKYDFTQETLSCNWGIVYTRPGSGIETILDLEAKTVALLNESTHTNAFMELVNKFNIQPKIVPMDNYYSGFEMVEKKKADAVIVNRIFGL